MAKEHVLQAIKNTTYIEGVGYLGKYHIWDESEFEYLLELTMEYRPTKVTEWMIREVFLGLKDKPGEGKITNAMIQKAKEVPIEQMLEFQQGFAHCIWHSEKTASLKLFSDNKVYCFGACGKRYDAIDIIMKLRDYDFGQAVRYLNGK